jgi:hypothetical protein
MVVVNFVVCRLWRETSKYVGLNTHLTWRFHAAIFERIADLRPDFK